MVTLICPKCGIGNCYQKTSSEIVLAICKCGYKIINNIESGSLVSPNIQGITWQK